MRSSICRLQMFAPYPARPASLTRQAGCRRALQKQWDLSDLVPEGGITGSQERVLARLPAEEVRGARVRGVMLAAFPDFVEQERAGLIGAAMQIVLQAAIFLAGGSDEGAKFGLEEQVLALLGAENDDEGESAFREFGDLGAAGLVSGPRLRGFLRFSFGHIGGDCTLTAAKSNGNCGRLWLPRA